MMVYWIVASYLYYKYAKYKQNIDTSSLTTGQRTLLRHQHDNILLPTVQLFAYDPPPLPLS